MFIGNRIYTLSFSVFLTDVQHGLIKEMQNYQSPIRLLKRLLSAASVFLPQKEQVSKYSI